MATNEIIAMDGIRQQINASNADLTGSSFHDVKLAGASLEDVSLIEAKFTNCNLSGVQIDNADLSGIQISNANLNGAALHNCATEAMTIDGVLVSKMMAAYRAAHPKAD